MPRQARLDAPGTLHHLIIRGIERRRIVDDNTDRNNFVSRLGALASETDMSIYAWALMTNHAHILIRSGLGGISSFMRRFLTGYAVSYNRRHGRHGHLFQNRYKSIICDEDTYFAELVRYIHLNPLRAGLVKTLSDLDRYAYCGHSVLMSTRYNDWQDRNHVLKWFGNKEERAMRAYREFVLAGIDEGRRPDLVGGGLIRSIGGWSVVKSKRRRGERSFGDERILGSSDFVNKVLDDAIDEVKQQVFLNESKEKIKEVMEEICKKEDVTIHQLQSGGRRADVSRARARIAYILVEGHGISLSDTARSLGVTTSAIFNILKRRNNKFN